MLQDGLTHRCGGKVGGLCFILPPILQEASLGSSHGDLRLPKVASPNAHTPFNPLLRHVCECSDGQSNSPGQVQIQGVERDTHLLMGGMAKSHCKVAHVQAKRNLCG